MLSVSSRPASLPPRLSHQPGCRSPPEAAAPLIHTASHCSLSLPVHPLQGYYLILVTKRRRVGQLCGHAVYTVEETETVELPHPSIRKDASSTDAYNERCVAGAARQAVPRCFPTRRLKRSLGRGPAAHGGRSSVRNAQALLPGAGGYGPDEGCFLQLYLPPSASHLSPLKATYVQLPNFALPNRTAALKRACALFSLLCVTPADGDPPAERPRVPRGRAARRRAVAVSQPVLLEQLPRVPLHPGVRCGTRPHRTKEPHRRTGVISPSRAACPSFRSELRHCC